jgi:uncharacterized integral membrane protein
MEASRSTPSRGKNGTPWSLILFAVVALYALLLIILNDERVSVHFVFFEARISKLVLILLCLGLGFVAGFLFDHWRARRKARESG